MVLLTTSLSAWGQGSIVAVSGMSIGFPDLVLTYDQVSAGPFDIRGDGVATFGIEGEMRFLDSGTIGIRGTITRAIGIYAMTPIEVLKTYRAPVALTRGAEISPNIQPGAFWGNLYGTWHSISGQSLSRTSPGFGPWSGLLGQSGEVFTGFRIPTASGYQYGWIGIALVGTNASTLQPVLTGWAYQTQPGLSITAGAVPEPGTLAMAGIGVAALLCLKRKRPRTD